MESITHFQRAFLYGDTLFETIRVTHGRSPLLALHIARLLKGTLLLGMDISPEWDLPFFEQQVKVAVGDIAAARVRVTVWRSDGGLYLPTNNQAQLSVSATALTTERMEWQVPITIGICQKIRLPIDQFSEIKTLNAPRYVQAAMEARRSGWDDGLVLNCHGRICEATSSNLFWWNGDVLHTVPLSEGCVAGIMREFLLKLARNAGIQVRETPITPEALLEAEEIFCTNAIRGIVPVGHYQQKIFGTHQTLALFDQMMPVFK